MYSPDHGIRSLIISGSNSKKYGSVHRTVAVSMDTGEVLHMLKPGNSGVPTSISTSTSKHTDMISIGYNDGGLDFWKYTLETESSSSTKASPISSIEGTNNKDVVEDLSQETLHRDLPVAKMPDSEDVVEKHRNTPICLIFGSYKE